MSRISGHYTRMFSDNPEFRDTYLYRRTRLYEKVLQIVSAYGARSVLDIGCAFGQFVEICNASGIEAIGVDLPIDDLRRFHEQLPNSHGRFLYGDVGTDDVLEHLAQYEFDVAVILDTLRHIEGFYKIPRIKAHVFLIKEASNTRRARKKQRIQAPVRFWSPAEVADLFSDCTPDRIYAPKFLFHINRPGPLTLRTFNLLSPTYTIVLRRNASYNQSSLLY